MTGVWKSKLTQKQRTWQSTEPKKILSGLVQPKLPEPAPSRNLKQKRNLKPDREQTTFQTACFYEANLNRVIVGVVFMIRLLGM